MKKIKNKLFIIFIIIFSINITSNNVLAQNSSANPDPNKPSVLSPMDQNTIDANIKRIKSQNQAFQGISVLLKKTYSSFLNFVAPAFYGLYKALLIIYSCFLVAYLASFILGVNILPEGASAKTLIFKLITLVAVVILFSTSGEFASQSTVKYILGQTIDKDGKTQNVYESYNNGNNYAYIMGWVTEFDQMVTGYAVEDFNNRLKNVKISSTSPNDVLKSVNVAINDKNAQSISQHPNDKAKLYLDLVDYILVPCTPIDVIAIPFAMVSNFFGSIKEGIGDLVKRYLPGGGDGKTDVVANKFDSCAANNVWATYPLSFLSFWSLNSFYVLTFVVYGLMEFMMLLTILLGYPILLLLPIKSLWKPVIGKWIMMFAYPMVIKIFIGAFYIMVYNLVNTFVLKQNVVDISLVVNVEGQLWLSLVFLFFLFLGTVVVISVKLGGTSLVGGTIVGALKMAKGIASGGLSFGSQTASNIRNYSSSSSSTSGGSGGSVGNRGGSGSTADIRSTSVARNSSLPESQPSNIQSGRIAVAEVRPISGTSNIGVNPNTANSNNNSSNNTSQASVSVTQQTTNALTQANTIANQKSDNNSLAQNVSATVAQNTSNQVNESATSNVNNQNNSSSVVNNNGGTGGSSSSGSGNSNPIDDIINTVKDTGSSKSQITGIRTSVTTRVKKLNSFDSGSNDKL